GSESVLNTSAATGALGSGERVPGCFALRSVPATSPRSAGEGSESTTRSSSAADPRLRAAEAQRTGTSLPPAMPARNLGSEHLGLAERAFLEVLAEQLVVRLGSGFDELLAVLLDPVREVAGHLALARL